MAVNQGYWTGGQRHSAPFVLKIRFYDPSLNKANPAKNAAHIHYIGYRQGVDKGYEFEPERKDAGYDPDTPAGHLGYAHQRPRSHGLFWGEEEPPKPADLQKELSEHQGIVWRMILSLKDVDAQRLGMTTRESWEVALRGSVANAAAEMGIPESNLRWAAAFHDEPGHPHVHLVLWEREPKRKLGVLNKGEYRAVKKEYMREIYANERMAMNAEKTLMRDMTLQLTKGNVLDRIDLYRDVREARERIELMLQAGGRIPDGFAIPKIHEFQADEFARAMEKLGEMLPGKGRLAYQYMPPNVKSRLDEMSKWVLYQPQFKEYRERYLKAAETMARQYTMKPDDVEAAIKKAEDDLCRRMSQIILRGASEMMKSNNFSIDPEKAQVVVERFSQASKRVYDLLPQQVTEQHVAILKHFGFIPSEQKAVLADWSQKAHVQLTQDELGKIVDKVNAAEEVVEIKPESGRESLIHILKFSGRDDETVTKALEEKGVDIEGIEPELKAADDRIKKAEQTLLNERDWNRLLKSLGIEKQAYPWKLEESAEIIADKTSLALAKFEVSQVTEEIRGNEREVGWTAFTMTVALKHMGFDVQERKEFMEKWIEKNGYDEVDLDSIMETIEKNDKKNEEEKEGKQEPRYLRKPTWERLTKNLGVELEYPWVTKEELVLDEPAYQQAMEKIEASIQQIEDPTERYWAAQAYIKLIKNDPNHNRNYAEVLAKWEEKAGPLSGEQRSAIIRTAEKRTRDIEHFSKRYEFKDEMYRFLNDFAKVLYAAGLNRDQVSKIMDDWMVRSGSVVLAEKMDRAVAAAEKFVADLREWKRVPVMSKKNFHELCQKLGVEAPWMWRSDKQYDRMQSSAFGKFLRGFGKIIEREMKKNEAQMEMEKRRFMARAQRNAEREERERDKENRGR